MYEKFYVNLTTSIPRSLLEDLAQGLVNSNATHRLAKLVDQYLDYCCLEENLFSLQVPNMFTLFHSPKGKEEDVRRGIEKISNSLFCVLLSIGGPPPVIVVGKGDGSSDAIATQLEAKIRNQLQSEKQSDLGAGRLNLHDQLGLQRPIVLIIDRSFDLISPLRHSSTYNSLVHDVFGVRLNRINLPPTEQRQNNMLHIDDEDWFWRENSSKIFPSVTEAVDSSLSIYKADQEKITKGGKDLSNAASEALNAEELRLALKVIPELTERKRIIDVHLSICSALLEAIKKRDLGDLVALQKDPQKTVILDAIKTKGSLNDKLRLFLIYYLQHPDLSKVDLEEFERALKATGVNPKDIEKSQAFLKQLLASSSLLQQQFIQSKVPAATSGTIPSPTTLINPQLLQRITEGSAFVGGMWGNLVSSVKNLIPESSSDSPLCKRTDLVLDFLTSPPGTSAVPLKIYDPRASKSAPIPSSHTIASGGGKSAYNHLIVFVVGGVTYQEINNLSEHLVKRSRIKPALTMGGSEILNADAILRQLIDLGSEH